MAADMAEVGAALEVATPERALMQGALDVLPTITLPSRVEWAVLCHIANALAESGILGKHLNGRPKAVLAVILKGRELGLPQMEALNSIYIIEGTPTLSAHLMLALIRRAGHDVWWINDGSAGEARLGAQRLRRDGSYSPHTTEFSWTLEDAARAGLLVNHPDGRPHRVGGRDKGGCGCKDNWINYSPAMLRARCVSSMGRAEFSDVLMGAVYTYEEMGAVVDQDGNVERLPTRGEAAEAKSAAEANSDDTLPPQSRVPSEEALAMPDSDTVDAEVVTEEQQQAPFDRELWWREMQEQSRLLGISGIARWVKAHRKNIEDATDEELRALVEGRRDAYGQALAAEPPPGAAQ